MIEDKGGDNNDGQFDGAIEYAVLADNILSIADFSVDKYEHEKGRSISTEEREDAIQSIQGALWDRIEEVKKKQIDLLKKLYGIADAKLVEVIDEHENPHRRKESDIAVQWERRGGVLIGEVSGRVDAAHAEEFERLIGKGIKEHDNILLLDLERVPFISSSGLRASLKLAKRFSAPDKRFAICALSDSVGEIVIISGFDRMIDVFESRTAALAGMRF